ncbi:MULTISPECIES: hypothetical protein [Novacetimonas]|uniref:hypothetical protein n=1 Tax=Novacetimonas TaxID=2919364 RepID=UPI000789AD12|nr:hypothetical protein [Novacetimonas hansenii]MBL7236787.1 hypothetical protein [Novacetimonas hansenii]RFP05294.1 hypothetical protein BGC30_01600 [Novacetimonas hansenii]WEQ58383.1 hypothetical protein LV563_11040 [Novacetimonas hansenii]CUW48470.1 hypothetical protein ATCC53582_02608 [Novacetimonas hansenii]
MRSLPSGLTLPMVVTFALATGPALARDRDNAASASVPQPVSQSGASAAHGVVEGAPGARLAGYLNFCIGNGLLPHGDTTPLLDHLIARTHAVSDDHRGDMEYAYGTAGVLHPADADGPRVTDLDIPQRRELCAHIRRKAASIMG